MCVCVCELCVNVRLTQHLFVGFRGDLSTQLRKQRKKKGLGTTGREAPSSAALVSLEDEETEGRGDDEPEEEEEEEEITPDPEDGLPRVKDILQVRVFLFFFLFPHSLDQVPGDRHHQSVKRLQFLDTVLRVYLRHTCIHFTLC